MGPIIGLIIVIVIISAVVGAIAQFLNKLNELNAPGRKPAVPARPNAGGGGAVRQSGSDMDRFLAEIDRLRKKNADSTATQTANKPSAPEPKPQPRQADRPRPRVVADAAEPPAQPRRRETTDAAGFTAPPAAPASPITSGSSSRPEDLPVATVVSPTSSTGAPSTRVTRLPQRNRPTPKTDLAKNLTGLLNSGQGIAMAVILQEVLGPPKSQRR